MNAVEKLLAYDAGKLEVPKKVITMKLRKLGGEEFEFPIQAVDAEVMAELQESMLTMDAKSKKMNMSGSFNRSAMTIVEGCPEIFRNKDIMARFKAPTPKELVKKLLVAGEMEDLRDEIEALSGYETESEEDIKN